MHYGQPNGELTTGNICKFEENLQNVLHSQSIDEPVSKKNAEYFFPKTVHASKPLFLVLGSISAIELKELQIG